MTISEYEIFGATDRTFTDLVRGDLAILRHSYGESITDVQSRTMHAIWELSKYDQTGERSHLVRAAAWLWAEWLG